MSYQKYVRMCARKKRFRTEAEAQNVGLKLGQRAYECSCCGGWHNTKAPETERP
jgi:hypothetical protein